MTFRAEQLYQPPSASAMCESMRSLGYSVGAAVSDLVDNSVAASAKNVWISLADNRSSKVRRLALLDDGHGMSAEGLLNAMRPGSRSPLESRASSDLGRFGLGLKTASFSQCRSVTVATRGADQKMRVLRWDLDHVRRTDRWELLEGPDPAVADDLELLRSLETTGTLVLWTKLDRVSTSGVQVIRELRQHLALTFHRLLESREPGSLRLFTTMSCDRSAANPIPPADPFNRQNVATLIVPQEKIGAGCTVRGYVLPHPDKCTSDELQQGELGATWRDRQGCYVYRNRRLIASGGWLDLDRHWKKDPETQLARIQIDIDNAWDERWKIDVMKSRASPPPDLRERLREYSRLVRNESIDVFRFRYRPPARTRSQVGEDMSHVPLWIAERTEAATRFRVSEAHPAVKALCASSPLAMPVLRLIAETLPLSALWYEFNAGLGEQSQTAARPFNRLQLKLDLIAYVEYELDQGRPIGDVIARARTMAPFDELEDLVDTVASAMKATNRF